MAVKKCIFRRMIQKIKFRLKLWEMDRWWYETDACSWDLFPPSFYYTHTKEEIERITEETVKRLRKKIEELE